MKTYSCIALIALLLTAGPASAATYDLTGTWSYTTSGNWVTGVCPKGADSTGTLQITQTGDTFTMTILTGMVCKPASMCSYAAGTIAGATYTITNTAVVDNEGGTATNTVTFAASSDTAATGTDSSTYVHPKTTCTWGFNIVLSRGAPDGGPTADVGGTPGKDIGAGAPDADAGKVDAATGVPAPKDDNDGCQIGGGGAIPLWSALPFIGALLALRRRRRR